MCFTRNNGPKAGDVLSYRGRLCIVREKGLAPDTVRIIRKNRNILTVKQANLQNLPYEDTCLSEIPYGRQIGMRYLEENKVYIVDKYEPCFLFKKSVDEYVFIKLNNGRVFRIDICDLLDRVSFQKK